MIFRRIAHDPVRILSPFVKAGDVALDIGCGPGFFTVPLARMVGERGQVVAVDIQPKMLEGTRRRAARAGVSDRIRLHLATGEGLELRTKADFALAFWMAHEVRGLERFFAEILASMKPIFNARSWLFAPGDSERKMEKATASAADIVLLDLEDAVAEEQKPAARAMVSAFLRARPLDRERLWVRINPLQGPHALSDLAAVIPGRPGGIMLPKSRGRADVEALDHYLSALEVAAGIEQGSTRVIALVTETAEGMLSTGSYAGAPRLVAMTWGAEDLADALGASENRNADGGYGFTYELARSLCLLGAAAAGAPDHAAMHAPAGKAPAVPPVQVDKAKGPNAQTVAGIVTGAASLKDKPVTVRGQVVKFTADVMGKNWLHLRDGTGSSSDGSEDVLVVTGNTANVGDVVLVSGTVRTDRNLGSGYSYKVLIEEAKLTK